MSKPMVLIVGDSGTGKSSMFETLPPERTIILNTEQKPLPMRNFNQFKNVMIDTYKKLDSAISQLKKSDKYDYVVIDSFTSTHEMIQKYCKGTFSGWEVYDSYNAMIMELIGKLKQLPQQVFLVAIPEQKSMEFGETKSYVRVKGKELKYGFVEKEVAVVLFTNPQYADEGEDEGEMIDVLLDYKPNKKNTAKAPRGLFEKKPNNDALFVANAIKEYYES